MQTQPSCPMPENESQRIAAIRSYEILDTEPELEFDALTRVAARAFDVPIALVAIMDSDRLWFKSRLGLDVPQLDRKIAFCAHAIMRPHEPLVVEDLRADARFSANPLVVGAPRLRFYAGAPIVDPMGNALGTIAIVDAMPRSFGPEQRESLLDMATLVMTALHSRRRALDLERLAMTDHLTGIGNRARFDRAIVTEVRHVARTGETCSLLSMDLDGFKNINDRLGHAAGDEVLCEVARRLGQLIRTGDTLVRLGGDEFAVVMRNADAASAAALAQRAVRVVEQPIALSAGETVQVTISVGTASATGESASTPALVAQADRALYNAKKRPVH